MKSNAGCMEKLTPWGLAPCLDNLVQIKYYVFKNYFFVWDGRLKRVCDLEEVSFQPWATRRQNAETWTNLWCSLLPSYLGAWSRPVSSPVRPGAVTGWSLKSFSNNHILPLPFPKDARCETWAQLSTGRNPHFPLHRSHAPEGPGPPLAYRHGRRGLP